MQKPRELRQGVAQTMKNFESGGKNMRIFLCNSSFGLFFHYYDNEVAIYWLFRELRLVKPQNSLLKIGQESFSFYDMLYIVKSSEMYVDSSLALKHAGII